MYLFIQECMKLGLNVGPTLGLHVGPTLGKAVAKISMIKIYRLHTLDQCRPYVTKFMMGW